MPTDHYPDAVVSSKSKLRRLYPRGAIARRYLAERPSPFPPAGTGRAPAACKAAHVAPTPLHRLLFLHHRTARDAAEVLGMSEHTVSRWLTGKRKPSYDALMKLAETYQVGIHLLDASRDKSPETWSQFLRELGDPERIERVETESIPAARRERAKEHLKVVEKIRGPGGEQRES